MKKTCNGYSCSYKLGHHSVLYALKSVNRYKLQEYSTTIIEKLKFPYISKKFQLTLKEGMKAAALIQEWSKDPRINLTPFLDLSADAPPPHVKLLGMFKLFDCPTYLLSVKRRS